MPRPRNTIPSYLPHASPERLVPSGRPHRHPPVPDAPRPFDSPESRTAFARLLLEVDAPRTTPGRPSRMG